MSSEINQEERDSQIQKQEEKVESEQRQQQSGKREEQQNINDEIVDILKDKNQSEEQQEEKESEQNKESSEKVSEKEEQKQDEEVNSEKEMSQKDNMKNESLVNRLTDFNDEKKQDSGEFNNQKIVGVKSGQFIFTQHSQESGKSGNNLKISRKGNPQKQEQPKKKRTYKQKKYITFQDNKNLKRIFDIFCKNQNLKSIKNELFEQKFKTQHQMSLNKWMILCKQLDIMEAVCKSTQSEKDQFSRIVEHSQSRYSLGIDKNAIDHFGNPKHQFTTKTIKESQTYLTNVYKKYAHNGIILNFEGFVQALQWIQEKVSNNYDTETFLSEVIGCTTEKQCHQKLASLKIRQDEPTIKFQKLYFVDIKERQNKKLKKFSVKKFSNSFTTKSRYQLSNVLRQAKNQLNGKENFNTYMKRNHKKLQALKGQKKLENSNVDPLRKVAKKKRKQSPIREELLTFFDNSADNILENYFDIERRKTTHCSPKKTQASPIKKRIY